MNKGLIAAALIVCSTPVLAQQPPKGPPQQPTPEQAAMMTLQRQRDQAQAEASNAMASIAMMQAKAALVDDYWKKMWEGLYPSKDEKAPAKPK